MKKKEEFSGPKNNELMDVRTPLSFCLFPARSLDYKSDKMATDLREERIKDSAVTSNVT